MNVLLINGSAHPKGCVARALQEVAQTLQQEGIETTTVMVGNKDVRDCIGCYKCQETGHCVFNDLVNETAPLLEKADGVIVGTPVYYAHADGGVLSFLDRLFFSTTGIDKTMKVGATVVSSRRAGSTSAFDDVNKFFTMSGMPIAASTYWNEVHGFTAEDVEKDLEGLETLRNLGKAMAFLIKSIKMGEEKMGRLKLPVTVRTHFIR